MSASSIYLLLAWASCGVGLWIHIEGASEVQFGVLIVISTILLSTSSILRALGK